MCSCPEQASTPDCQVLDSQKRADDDALVGAKGALLRTLSRHAEQIQAKQTAFIPTRHNQMIVVKKKARELGEVSSQAHKLNAIIHVTANTQYNVDEKIHNINEAAQNLRALQCDFRKLKHALIISTAQNNGWLAV